MGPFEAIVVLIIVGFLMLAAEVFTGHGAGIARRIVPFGRGDRGLFYYDAVTGSIVFVGVCMFTVAGFLAWMAAFPHTAIGRRIMLQKSHAKGVGERASPSVLL
jgi:hypothetical protein